MKEGVKEEKEKGGGGEKEQEIASHSRHFTAWIEGTV
jgi:hypothetical protein